MKKILTIAGSDSSGGAGIQADLKTMTAHGMYGMSAVTALTAQNTTGVYGIQEVPPEFVALQLDCIFRDIRPDAVKIGMVSSAAIIRVIADKLTEYGAENIVIDPVMVATSGGKLMKGDAAEALEKRLFPLGAVITPNIPEAEALSGMSIQSPADMEAAAAAIEKAVAAAAGESAEKSAGKAEEKSAGEPAGKSVRKSVGKSAGELSEKAVKKPAGILIKGGHLKEDADDLLWLEGAAHWFHGARIDNTNTHGTGCTLSSAIACRLAEGFSVQESVRLAKEYVAGAIGAGLDLGRGSGPLNHMYLIK